MKKMILSVLTACLIFLIYGCSDIAEEPNMPKAATEQSELGLQKDPFSDAGMEVPELAEPDNQTGAQQDE